jgi:Ankyrin repeats (3 copies)/Ankyrin repeats (many copies)
MKKMLFVLISYCFSLNAMESPSLLNQQFARAVLAGRVEEAKSYLEKGANPAYDPNLLCKLLKLIFNQPVASVKQRALKDQLIELLIYEPNTVVNCQDSDGTTPLMILVRQNEIPLVELLLGTERVNVKAENNQGLTAFDMAKSKEMRELLKLGEVPAGSGKRKIVQRSPAKSPSKSPKLSPIKEFTWETPLLVPQHKSAKQEFFEVVQQGNIARLKDMIKGGYPSYINDTVQQLTPLMIAVQQQSLPVVQLLLKAPLLDLKKENISGNTALILAVIQDNLEIVKALLNDGRSDINQLNKFAYTALDFVKETANGHEIKKLLLDRGAKKGNDVFGK